MMPPLESWEKQILDRGALYLVGGSVRDRYLTGDRKDLDYLVTGIAVDELGALLAAHGRVTLVGRSFGVIRFVPEGRDEVIDVALPRRELSTGSGHRDFSVDFDPTLPVESDLGRRDFTMNAMALELPSRRLIDPFGGEKDIRERRLRLVFPDAFREDPLRMLRAAQFVARFELTVDDDTRRSMREHFHLASTISPERVQEELTKLLTLSATPSLGLRLMKETRLLFVLLPELAKADGVAQPAQWHRHDVLEHSLLACDAAPRDNLALRLAALLHDTGKVDKKQEIVDPRTGERRTVFYGHEEASRRDAAAVLRRLRYSRQLEERVDALIACHMFDYQPEWSDAAVRRLIARVGKEAIGDLIDLRRADQIASGVARELHANDELRRRVDEELARETATTVRDLAIDGHDIVRELEIRPGPAVGKILERLLDEVLDDPARNERSRLLQRLREIRAEEAAG